jgi:hypothetical protein
MPDGELYPIIKDTAQPFIESVGSTLADVWQGIIGDKVAAWRIRNAVALNAKLEKHLAKSDVRLNLERIPERIAFSWFDKATQTDEPEIQELFAKILANAALGNVEATKRRNLELISSLSPSDAKFLSFIASAYLEFRSNENWEYRTFQYRLDYTFRRELRDCDIDDSAIDALNSLGITRITMEMKPSYDIGARIKKIQSKSSIMASFDAESMFELIEHLTLTSVGVSLILAIYPNQ